FWTRSGYCGGFAVGRVRFRPVANRPPQEWASIKEWTASYYSPSYCSRQHIYLTGAAIDAQALAGAETAHHLRQASDRGKTELTSYDGAMREHAACFHDQTFGQDKERHPGRIGRWAHQDEWFGRQISRGLLKDQSATLGNSRR